MSVNEEYTHQLPDDTFEEWELHGYRGWRPSIALPYMGSRARCGCGKKFKTLEDYEAHYLYMAIWRGESTVLPTEWRKANEQVAGRVL